MELRDRIAASIGPALRRRIAPALGSVVTHAAMALALVSLMAASTSPKPAPLRVQRPPELEVTLIAETPPIMRQTTPSPSTAPPSSTPRSDSVPAAPAEKPRKGHKQAAKKPAPTHSDDEGVYVGPSVLSQSDVPLGLRGMLEADPCSWNEESRKSPQCAPSWGQKLALGGLLVEPSEATLKRMYPGFGEGPSRGDMLKQRHEPGVFQPRGLPNGGVEGLGGIHDLVGRLPQ